MAPNRFADQLPPPGRLKDLFRIVEDSGFSSLWVTDRLLHDKIGLLHPFSLLTSAATVTSRIRLGTAVLLLTMRHPVEIARYAHSIDYLSEGRLSLGVSLGGRPDEYLAMNAPAESRVGRLEEGVAILRALGRGEPVTFRGRHYQLDGATVLPPPVQHGGIPLILGAGSGTDVGLRRAGRIADGWIMGTAGESPADFARAWGVVCEAAAAAGRNPSDLQNASLLNVNPDADLDRGARDLDRALERYFGPSAPSHARVVGSPAVIAEEVLRYGDAGCQEVLLSLPWLDLDKVANLARVAEFIA